MIPLALAAEPPGEPASGAVLVILAAGLVLLAMALFFLEVLFPSLGMITIVGLVCVGGALVTAFSVSQFVGFVFVGVTVLALPLTATVAFRFLRRSGAVLEASSGPAGDLPNAPAGPAPGATGVAMSALRPSGTAVFDGKRVSVVTEGPMVSAQERVEVIRVEGGRTVVRAVRGG